MQLSHAVDEEVDTDEFVTKPMARCTVPAKDFPVVPTLAEHLILAAESIARRTAPPKIPMFSRGGARARHVSLNNPLIDGDLPMVTLALIRGARTDGITGADLWPLIVAAHGERWSRSQLQNALLKLEGLRRVRSEKESGGRRRYFAVVAE